MVVFGVKLLAPCKNHIGLEDMGDGFCRMCQLRMFFWFAGAHTSCMASCVGIDSTVFRDSRRRYRSDNSACTWCSFRSRGECICLGFPLPFYKSSCISSISHWADDGTCSPIIIVFSSSFRPWVVGWGSWCTCPCLRGCISWSWTFVYII